MAISIRPILIYQNMDFSGGEILNAVLHSSGAQPSGSSVVTGQIYFDNVNQTYKYFHGGSGDFIHIGQGATGACAFPFLSAGASSGNGHLAVSSGTTLGPSGHNGASGIIDANRFHGNAVVDIEHGGTNSSGYVTSGITYTNGTSIIASTGLTYDFTNRRIGIGTNIPSGSLHIINTGVAPPIIISTGLLGNAGNLPEGSIEKTINGFYWISASSGRMEFVSHPSGQPHFINTSGNQTVATGTKFFASGTLRLGNKIDTTGSIIYSTVLPSGGDVGFVGSGQYVPVADSIGTATSGAYFGNGSNGGTEFRTITMADLPSGAQAASGASGILVQGGNIYLDDDIPRSIDVDGLVTTTGLQLRNTNGSGINLLPMFDIDDIANVYVPNNLNNNNILAIVDTTGQVIANQVVIGNNDHTYTRRALVLGDLPTIGLNDLNGVSVTGATSGQTIGFNGVVWLPTAAGGGGGGASELNDLTDVSNSSDTSGQILQSNGTTYNNVALRETIGFSVQGNTITTGTKTWKHLPYDATIESFTVISDATGTIEFQLFKSSGAAGIDSPVEIIGTGNQPMINNVKAVTSGIVGWASSGIASDDILHFAVSGSPTGITQATLSLTIRRGS